MDARTEQTDIGQSVSDARLVSVLNTAVDGIVVMDERGRILVFNAACENMFDYHAHEVIGRNVKCLMPLKYAQEHDTYVSHYIETGEKQIIGIGREVSGRRRDGTEFPLELSVGEARTPAGRQFVGILRDVSARKANERRIAELQSKVIQMTRLNTLDEVGAAIAHELNQPLTAILLYAQVLEKNCGTSKPLDGNQFLNLLQKVSREANRASEIIQRMRRIVDNREPKREQVQILDVIRESVELVSVSALAHTAEIRILVEPELPLVLCDSVQISQVLVNIIRNGLEAIQGEPEQCIEIQARRVGEFVEVAIQDSGPGVTESDREDLFRAFSSPKQSGMGVGLAISRSIAQNHGGDLKLADARPGTGARFLLTIPVRRSAAPALDR